MAAAAVAAAARKLRRKQISAPPFQGRLTSVAVLNTVRCSTGSQCNFLSTGVILVYRLVFGTILAALFWMHCNLCS